MMTIKPSFDEEVALWEKGYDYIVGIDEVGRGAFAGPVVAAAVVFSKDIMQKAEPLLYEITDSKLLLPKKREELAGFVTAACHFSSISTVPVSKINNSGILKASFCAFREVLSHVCRQFDPTKVYVLSDGFPIPYVRKIGHNRQKAIIKGDQKSISIAAASIIAKVHRDTLMDLLHKKYSHYDFKKNKGYGTKFHRDAISRYGLSKVHRTSFNLTKFLSAASF